MILSAHQPGYLPWLGLFHKIYLSENFVFFDIVQYQKKEFDNRNLIKTSSGPLWLSIPVSSKNHFNKFLFEIEIQNNEWKKKHLKTIEISYKKTPFFENFFYDFRDILLTDFKYLVELNISLIKFFLNILDINTKLYTASDFNFVGSKSELVLDMCKKMGSKKYIFGSQGKSYANIESFSKNNIDLIFQDYKHPIYNQLYGKFSPFMSILDLIFNEGELSRDILLKGNVQSV
jgi:hypothetical protein